MTVALAIEKIVYSLQSVCQFKEFGCVYNLWLNFKLEALARFQIKSGMSVFKFSVSPNLQIIGYIQDQYHFSLSAETGKIAALKSKLAIIWRQVGM